MGNKVYEDDQLAYRFSIFKNSMDEVLKHNSGNKSWTIGINQFSDLTQAEFDKMLGSLPLPGKKKKVSRKLSSSSVPSADVDWRNVSGSLTPVKNQGDCGCSYAFSTTGVVEGSLYRRWGKTTSLSESMLVDCTEKYGTQGCNGGLMEDALAWIQINGIASEAAYPYVAQKNKCHKYTSFTQIASYKFVDNNVGALETAVAVQPIVVALDGHGWKSYTGGVYACSGRIILNQGALLVGSYSDYWVVKNSFGSDWGMQGYIQISKEQDKDCGITQYAIYPTV